jgi:hypothetical protein
VVHALLPSLSPVYRCRCDTKRDINIQSLGTINIFLGNEITINRVKKELYIYQLAYTNKILIKYNKKDLSSNLLYNPSIKLTFNKG